MPIDDDCPLTGVSDRDAPPMPEGNGDKNCPKCYGRGVVPIEIDGWPGGGAENCDCVFRRDIVANVQRIWPVLLTAESVEDSPLLKLTQQSLWITASNYLIRRHLRFVAFRMGTQWDARVIADATLATAWLSTAKEVRDPDVLVERQKATPSDEYQTLVDLAVPFGLLIIRLGVKAASNKEMPAVLAEAINERDLLGKPTWVIDSPTNPITNPQHKCHSDQVIELLSGMRRIVLEEEGAAQVSAYAKKAVSTETSNPYQTRTWDMSRPDLEKPKKTPVPKVADDDDDPLSIDSLIKDAASPVVSSPPPGSHLPEEGPTEDDENPADFPKADKVLASIMGPLTVAEREFLAQKKKGKGKGKGGSR